MIKVYLGFGLLAGASLLAPTAVAQDWDAVEVRAEHVRDSIHVRSCFDKKSDHVLMPLFGGKVERGEILESGVHVRATFHQNLRTFDISQNRADVYVVVLILEPEICVCSECD